MPASSIRVLIADDHAMVREGLARLLRDYTDVRIVATVGAGYELSAATDRQVCDVILLDVAMPGPEFLELLQSLKARHPETGVLVLGTNPEERYAIRAIRSGADGYLTKDSAADELVAAIRRVAGGGKYVTASLAERLASLIAAGEKRAPHGRLSDRELQVLLGMGAGKRQKELAAEMNVSTKTVATFRLRLMRKMGFRTNADAIRYVIEHGLTD